MNLKVLRARKFPERTIGQLYIEDEFFCFTLEDTVREVPGQPISEWKIFGKTAIPVGKYKITLELSPKFGPDTLTINDVPGYEGVRMHPGNTEADTEGCIILGYKLYTAAGADPIIQPGTTRPAVADLKARVKAATDEVWLTLL